MDKTGCPVGFATDSVFLFGGRAQTCDVQLGGYIAFATFLIALRVVTAVIHVLDWRKRQANAKRKLAKLRPGKIFKRRLPIVPALSVIYTIIYGLFCVLIGLNVINAENGGVAFIYGVGWTLFGLLSLFFLTKFVSLGYRIVPRARIPRFETMTGADKLSSFTLLGRVGLVLLVLLLIAQFVLLCVVGFLYNADDRYIRAAIGVQAVFVGTQGVSALNHLERVKRVILESRNANAASAGATATSELSFIVRKLVQYQLVLGSCVAVGGVLKTLVATGIIKLWWFTPFVFMLLETMFMVLIVFSNKFGGKSSRSPLSELTSGAEQNSPLYNRWSKSPKRSQSSPKDKAGIPEIPVLDNIKLSGMNMENQIVANSSPTTTAGQQNE